MTDFVNDAEKAMKKLSSGNMVTTGQIRKFLTAVNTVTGKVDQFKRGQKGTKLPEDLQMQVKFLKVKLAYQIGRMGKPVKDFSDETHMMAWIDSIGDSVEKYERFARYVEALVAFHKYYSAWRDK